MVNGGNPADFAYDVITGVSAGSINTAALAGWAVGDEKAAAQWMSDLYMKLTSDQVWKDWRFGKVQGVTLKNGMVDNSPLVAYLRGIVGDPMFSAGFKRRVTLATVNVNNGEYTEFTQKNITFAQLADAAVASSSIPFVFPPYNWAGKGLFMDGGTVYNINVEGAIRQCMDIVNDESKIIMDVFICTSPDEPEVWTDDGKSFTNFWRERTLRNYWGSTDSLASSVEAHPKIKMRYVIN